MMNPMANAPNTTNGTATLIPTIAPVERPGSETTSEDEGILELVVEVVAPDVVSGGSVVEATRSVAWWTIATPYP